IGSSSGPPHARGITMPKTPASFIAVASGGGIRRPCSISSLADRICGAKPIAACRICESSFDAFPAMWGIGNLPIVQLKRFFIELDQPYTVFPGLSWEFAGSMALAWIEYFINQAGLPLRGVPQASLILGHTTAA